VNEPTPLLPLDPTQPLRRQIPLWVPAIIVWVLTGVLFMTVGAFTQLINVATGMWLTELLVFGAVPLLVLRAFGFAPLRTTGLDAFTLPGLLYGFLLGVVNFFAVAMPTQWVALQVFPKSVVKIFDAGQLFHGLGTAELAATTLAVSLAAPLCEEICFRGLLNRGLAEKLPPWLSILLGAAIFSAFHLDPVGFMARFFLGALFGWLAWKSGSIWPGIGAHAGNNATSMVLYLLSGDRGGDDIGTAQQVGATFVTAGLVLSALLQLPRRFPGLLTAKKPAETVVVGPKEMIRPIGYWIGAVVFTISAVFVVDSRGAQLGFIDAKHGVRFDNPKDPEALELNELRAKARRGEVELEVYDARSKELSKKHPLFDFAPTSGGGARDAGPPETPDGSSPSR
jgi:membrane protease YdiL (CAAX protease family)